MFGKLSPLGVALIFSVAVHAALLTIRLVDPERFNRIFEDTPLEVILVNSRSSAPVEHAQAVAQVSLAGGGEAATGRATSPLLPSAQAEIGDAEETSRKQIEQLQQAQQQLLTQVRRELALMPSFDPSHDESSLSEREVMIVTGATQAWPQPDSKSAKSTPTPTRREQLAFRLQTPQTPDRRRPSGVSLR